jgi:hypothetical protein
MDYVGRSTQNVSSLQVEFCFTQGVDLRTDLPSPDRLFEAEELSHLKTNPNVQFLIR